MLEFLGGFWPVTKRRMEREIEATEEEWKNRVKAAEDRKDNLALGKSIERLGEGGTSIIFLTEEDFSQLSWSTSDPGIFRSVLGYEFIPGTKKEDGSIEINGVIVRKKGCQCCGK